MTDNLWNKKYGLPEPACLLKWSWTSLFLEQGRSSSCHRPRPDDVTLENFNDFHNTEGQQTARKKMLAGQWPGRGCEYCRDIERVGGLSDRLQINNQERDFEDLTPKELKENPLATKVTPTTLEVFFSSVCNMSCIYCFPRVSSKIEAEYRRFNLRDSAIRRQEHLDDIRKRRENYPQMKEKFWQWMSENAQHLKNYHILGGEPFYQPEIFENIEFFENHPCPDLDVQVFTNMNVATDRVRKILQSFAKLIDQKHIRSLRIKMSVDSWGPAEEYVRTGSKLSVVKKNFTMIENEFPMFNVNILSTLCSLNIKGAAELARMYNNSKFADNMWNHHGFNIAGGHPVLEMGIFPKGFFDADFDAVIKEVKLDNFKQQLEGYKKLANSKPYDPGMVKKLKRHLDRIDERRNLNWREAFPWLDKFNPDDYPRED